MKKTLLFTLLFTFSVSSFSQTTEPVRLPKADYLKKARVQKTVGWVLIGSGFVLISAGVTAAIIEVNRTIWGVILPEPERKPSKAADVLLISGGVVMLSSIPFFSSASKNKRKAMSLSFQNQLLPQIQNNSFVYRTIPSLNMRITL